MKILDNIIFAFFFVVLSVAALVIVVLALPFLIVGSAVLTVFVFFGITYEYIIEFFKKGDKENGVL